jgi:hypothetical protein
MRKGKDPDPFLRLMDPDPGGPKTCGPADPQHWFGVLQKEGLENNHHQQFLLGFKNILFSHIQICFKRSDLDLNQILMDTAPEHRSGRRQHCKKDIKKVYLSYSGQEGGFQ